MDTIIHNHYLVYEKSDPSNYNKHWLNKLDTSSSNDNQAWGLSTKLFCWAYSLTYSFIKSNPPKDKKKKIRGLLSNISIIKAKRKTIPIQNWNSLLIETLPDAWNRSISLQQLPNNWISFSFLNMNFSSKIQAYYLPIYTYTKWEKHWFEHRSPL